MSVQRPGTGKLIRPLMIASTNDVPPSMNPKSIPEVLMRKSLAPLGVVDAQAARPGMSGAVVFRCRRRSGDDLAFKRWPEGTSRSRAQQIHVVIRHARQSGCEIVPTIHDLVDPSGGDQRASIVRHEGGLWELSQWLPGHGATADASLEQICEGAAIIAMFHASVRSLGVKHQPPPAALLRLQRLQQLDGLLPQAFQQVASFGHFASNSDRHLASAFPESPQLEQPSSQLAQSLSDASQLLRESWPHARERIARAMGECAVRVVPTQYVLRDIHRGHILFVDNSPSGLIDFDSVRIDTPATDLSRWVGSFLPGQRGAEDVWEAALAGFRRENPLITGSRCDIDPKMARELCFATNWISLANWLVWIVCERRFFPAGHNVIVSRIQELLRTAFRET